MSIDVLADISARTSAFAVEDGDGEHLARRVAFPPLGAHVVYSRRPHVNSISLGVGFYTATSAWDTSIPWAPTTWTLHADVGWRHSFASAEGLGFHMDVGGGPRLVTLQQPWWDDYVGVGLGEHVAVGYTLRGSWVIEARVESTLVLDSLTGALDSALTDLDWTWQASGLRVGVGFGRVF